MHPRPQICDLLTDESVGYRDARIQRGGFVHVCKAVDGEAFPAAWGWPDLNWLRGRLSASSYRLLSKIECAPNCYRRTACFRFSGRTLSLPF